MITLRFARLSDVPALLEIYRPYVEETSISFETEVPTPEEFSRRMTSFTEKFPYLVAEENGTPLGYAYAHAFHDRAAYDWTVETSIYVSREARGQHIGTKLYGALLPLLKTQGIKNVCAVVTQPNEASMGFHTAMGFTPVGTLPEAGYKLGAWRSVSYLWCPLGESGTAPGPLVPLHRLPKDLVEQILREAAEIS